MLGRDGCGRSRIDRPNRGRARSHIGSIQHDCLRGSEPQNGLPSHPRPFSASGAKRLAMKISVSVNAISSVDTAFTSGVTATLIIE